MYTLHETGLSCWKWSEWVAYGRIGKDNQGTLFQHRRILGGNLGKSRIFFFRIPTLLDCHPLFEWLPKMDSLSWRIHGALAIPSGGQIRCICPTCSELGGAFFFFSALWRWWDLGLKKGCSIWSLFLGKWSSNPLGFWGISDKPILSDNLRESSQWGWDDDRIKMKHIVLGNSNHTPKKGDWANLGWNQEDNEPAKARTHWWQHLL